MSHGCKPNSDSHRFLPKNKIIIKEKEEHLDTTQNAYHINKSEYEREKYDFFATQKICELIFY